MRAWSDRLVRRRSPSPRVFVITTGNGAVFVLPAPSELAARERFCLERAGLTIASIIEAEYLR
jgi:hypothetical protein